MIVEVQYEDGAWIHSLGEHNEQFKQMVYERVRLLERNAEGCPLRVVVHFEDNDIEQLKKLCKVNYWELPNKDVLGSLV